jgi:hypothetical protein
MFSCFSSYMVSNKWLLLGYFSHAQQFCSSCLCCSYPLLMPFLLIQMMMVASRCRLLVLKRLICLSTTTLCVHPAPLSSSKISQESSTKISSLSSISGWFPGATLSSINLTTPLFVRSDFHPHLVFFLSIFLYEQFYLAEAEPLYFAAWF